MEPSGREPQNVIGVATCPNDQFIGINIVQELEVRDEAGFVDELAAEQLVEDALQRPEGALILDADVPRKVITKVSLERIAVMHRPRPGTACSGGNGNENEYECTFGATRVPQEAAVVDSRVNVGDGRGSHDGNVTGSALGSSLPHGCRGGDLLGWDL